MSRLESRLPEIAAGIDEIMAEVLAETAEFILTFIRIFAPVKTGALRDSYQIEVESPLHILIGSTLLYAIFMELGFHHYKSGNFVGPYPHLVPAFLQGELFFRKAVEIKLKTRFG